MSSIYKNNVYVWCGKCKHYKLQVTTNYNEQPIRLLISTDKSHSE